MSKTSPIQKLLHHPNRTLQRIAGPLARWRLDFNQLSTDVADAGIEGVSIPPEVEAEIYRVMVQLEHIRNACRESAGLQPEHVLVPRVKTSATKQS